MKLKKLLFGFFIGMGLIFTMQTISSFAVNVQIPIRKAADGTVVQISEEEYTGVFENGVGDYKITYDYTAGSTVAGATIYNISDDSKLTYDQISPSEITINGLKYPVSAIGKLGGTGSALYKFSDTPQVFTIPDSIKQISDRQIERSDREKIATTYDNGYYFGTKDNPYYAFVGCKTDATECTLHEDTKIIAQTAFQSCNSLTKVTLPDGIERIDELVFTNHSGYSYAPNNLQFNEYGGCSYLGNDENPYLVLIKCNNPTNQSYNPTVTEATIHKDTKIIAAKAFEQCRSLAKLHVGDGTQIIDEAEEGAFKLPDGLRNIGKDAFGSCQGLKKISIPETVTEIGSGVFSSSHIESVTLPNSITTIPPSLFHQCQYLKRINSDVDGELLLPSSVTKIEATAFGQISQNVSNCSFKLVIPESVERIENGAFQYSNQFETIVFPPEAEYGPDAFKFGAAKYLKEVFVPEGTNINNLLTGAKPSSLVTWEYEALPEEQQTEEGKTLVNIKSVKEVTGESANPIQLEESELKCDVIGGPYVLNTVGSGVQTTGGDPVGVEHIYDGYGYDATQHWSACSGCGQQEPESTKEPHQYGEISYTWSGDNRKCTAMRPCTICGYEEKETVASTSVTTDPTCTQDGNIVYTATFTNEAFAEQTKDVTITAPGHVWSDEWTQDENNHWHECTVCGAKKDEAAHTWEWNSDEDNHWHKCTTCGKTKDEAEHTWNDEWSTDENNHWHECTTCGEIKDKGWHDFTWSYDWIKEEKPQGNIWKYEERGICDECQKTESAILDIFVPTDYTPAENEFPEDARIWGYSVTDDEATIIAKGNKECFEYVEIPAKIGGDETESVPVVKIGEEAFSGCSNLQGVTIPPSVEFIGENAFQNCNSLGYIFVEKNVDISGAGITENVMIFRYEELTNETVPQDELTHVKITSVENVNGEKLDFSDNPLEFPNFAMGEDYLIDSVECCATETTSQWAEKVWNIYGTHNYYVDYTWADDYSKCTATGTCEHCGHKDSETVNTTSVIDPEPTCTESGYETYTATFTKGFETQEESTSLPALGHNWNKIFGWEKETTTEGDIWKLTTTRTCTVCGENESVGFDVFVPADYTPGENEFPEARIWKYSVDDHGDAIITSVDNSTLPDIYGLSEITIPARIGDEQDGYDVKAIANNAFENCNNMGPIVVVPPSVESIGNETFKDCENLMGVFAQKDTQIADDAFSNVSDNFILFRYDVLTGENVTDDGKTHVEITSIENADGTSIIENYYGSPVSFENYFTLPKDIMGEDYVIDSFVYCAEEIEESGKNTWYVYGEHDWKTEYIWGYNEGTLTCTAKKICQNISSHTEEVGTITITGNSTYDGEPHGLEIAGEIPGATVVYSTDEGDSKTWSSESPLYTDAGEYTVYVKVDGDENYATATIKIDAKSLTDDSITIDPTAFIYDGAPKAPKVKDCDTELTEGVDFTAIYKDKDDNPIEKDNITELGKYKVVVTGNENGNYSGEKEFEFGIYLLGDVNGDGSVDVRDLQMLYNHVARNIVLTDEQKIRADMDENGSIEIEDIPLLFNTISNN